jgi:hypothetical protein
VTSQADFPTRTLEPQAFHSALDTWFDRQAASNITFIPVFDPPVDPQDDYVVIYEAAFEPRDLDKARVEVWLTTDGQVAVGLETRKRIAKRLGTFSVRGGFAGGHEPVPIEQAALFRLLDLIAAGEIGIRTRGSLVGLRKTWAVASTEARRSLAAAGYGFLDWLRELPSAPTGSSPGILLYRPWNSR